MKAEYVFTESSPAIAGGATASSQPVAGSTSGTAGVAANLDKFTDLFVEAELTQDTGGTLDVYVQILMEATWVDYIHFTQLTAGSSTFKYAAVLPVTSRTAPIAVGTNLTPALAANMIVGGPWGDKMRLVMVPGTGAVGGTSNVVVRLLLQGPIEQ
jgi:hypothetical protein